MCAIQKHSLQTPILDTDLILVIKTDPLSDESTVHFDNFNLFTDILF